MLQKTYSIYSDDLNDVQLFVEAGKNHIACWCKKNNDAKLKAFEFFQCDDYTAENFEALIDNTRLYSKLLTMPVNNTLFYWNTDEVLCLPKTINDASMQSSFELMFGSSNDQQLVSESSDNCLVAWHLENNQQHAAQECFRGANFVHQYIPLFSSLKAMNKDGVYLFFYPSYFTLIVLQQEKLLFAQTRKFTAAEDVLYFVLNTFKQYNLGNETAVYCGGFIDANSKLYENLHQYLEGFQLINVDESLFETDEFKQYAAHYFMPYINYVV